MNYHQDEHADQPFFQFIAFTAPHFPLQTLAEDIARYRDKYLRGWDETRRDRWSRIQGLGLVSGRLSKVEYAVGPPYDSPGWLAVFGPGEVNRPTPWLNLTAEQRGFQVTKMAIHAAMVDRMDREVGRVLDQIRAMNAIDDTLVFFLSDNGASAEILSRDDDQGADPGSAATHLCQGTGWSTVCNTPFRRHKTWVHEGGIATPLIVHWPRGIAARGGLRHTPGHVIDLAPTILQTAGAKPRARMEGRRVAPSLPGRSLVAAFGADLTVRCEHLWWLHGGNRAIRVDDHKLVTARTDNAWGLYDLASDRAETRDLTSQMPHRVSELARLWKAKARQLARDSQSGFDAPN